VYHLRYTGLCHRSSGSKPYFFGRRKATSPFVSGCETCPRGHAGQSAKMLLMCNINGPIGKPRVDHLRGPIWEIRSSLGNRIARTLFAVEGDRMILLHGFIKKTQRTSSDDIELAERRLKEWLHGQK
jgi:phage-related protein